MASLAFSNKHLSTSAKREKAVRLTVSTSSAIEGIRAPFKAAKRAAKPAGKPSGKAKTIAARKLKHPTSV